MASCPHISGFCLSQVVRAYSFADFDTISKIHLSLIHHSYIWHEYQNIFDQVYVPYPISHSAVSFFVALLRHSGIAYVGAVVCPEKCGLSLGGAEIIATGEAGFNSLGLLIPLCAVEPTIPSGFTRFPVTL